VLQISDQEKRVVELEATGKQIPDELKSFRIREFPTPGKISSSLRNTPRGKALARWYVEYRRYCAYSHAAIQKLLLHRAQVGDLSLNPMLRRRYLEGKLEPGVLVSALAIACASAEIYETVGFDGELLESLVTVWDELSESSLLGRALWELRIEAVLPATVRVAPQDAST